MISLNLLRSPVFPDPTADRGKHGFRYAFYPHKGNIFEGNNVEIEYHFSMAPLVCNNNILIEGMVNNNPYCKVISASQIFATVKITVSAAIPEVVKPTD
jgi:alpha-mannosidase